MKKPFDFIGSLGVNVKIIEDELAERGFVLENSEESEGFLFKVYKTSPVIHHIHAKYRKNEFGFFADSFTVY